ncbi:6924_t:CDS:1, partial [Racocetra persica]
QIHSNKMSNIQDNAQLDQDNNLQDNLVSNQESNLEELKENTQISDIYVGLSFETWEYVKKWIYAFGLQQGFSYKIRRSESDDNGIIRQFIYEYSKSKKHDAQINVDPTK